MRQLHNEIIDPLDDGGLIEARYVDANDVIISDTMLRYLASPKLIPMADYHNMMCGCAICNTSKYFQKILKYMAVETSKTMKDKADNSRGKEKM